MSYWNTIYVMAALWGLMSALCGLIVAMSFVATTFGHLPVAAACIVLAAVLLAVMAYADYRVDDDDV